MITLKISFMDRVDIDTPMGTISLRVSSDTGNVIMSSFAKDDPKSDKPPIKVVDDPDDHMRIRQVIPFGRVNHGR